MYCRPVPSAPAASQPMTVRGEPFPTVEDAWFWTMAALAARRDGVRPRGGSGGGTPRPCTPDDVVRCLDALYRRRRLDLAHARILRIWGERRMAPNPARPAERSDWRLWREALERLAWPLRAKGIVHSHVKDSVHLHVEDSVHSHVKDGVHPPAGDAAGPAPPRAP